MNPARRALGVAVLIAGVVPAAAAEVRYDVLIRGGTVYDGTEAIRRLSALPAENLGLDRRGFLKEGMFADVVVFDPLTIGDRATYENPHQYAVGMRHVFVNGVQVLNNGEHTGALPGRALKGPGALSAGR
jgi:N-acyl-D-amino-acid deacylase